MRDEPSLRAALAQRYQAADEATRRMLRAALPVLAAADTDVVNELALAHSLLFEGLNVRLLADPNLISTEDAAALIERTMNAVGSVLLEHG